LLGEQASAFPPGCPSLTSPQKRRWGGLWNSREASLSEGPEQAHVGSEPSAAGFYNACGFTSAPAAPDDQ
jgi:hypothetical protein